MAMTETEMMDNADYRLEQAFDCLNRLSHLLEKSRRQIVSVYAMMAEMRAENNRMRKVLECDPGGGDSD